MEEAIMGYFTSETRMAEIAQNALNSFGKLLSQNPTPKGWGL